ncbi:MAG: hypothetical protein PUC65_13580, partial [Clostridiales bacterium]|nr:hypothetical protein [Clostridiales bacterium]
MNQYFNSPIKAELRLSGLIETLNRYTEDTLSSEYLAFFLHYSLIFLVIRIISCIIAYILNKLCEVYFGSFYDQHQYQKRINNIAHWEFYYHQHPNFFNIPEDQSVASKCEKTIQLEVEAIKEDLTSYIKNDEKLKNTYLQYLLSTDDTISIKTCELDLYLTYIKDKISIWKEDNLVTDSHLEQDVICDVTTKFNCIKDRYQSSMIENQTYFNIFWRYTNDLEGPLKRISTERRNVKQSIDQLYMYSDMLYWHKKCKESINSMMELFDKQAINFDDYSALLDGEIISFDNILITNRGLFLLDIETFDSTVPFELLIERDGCWYKRYQDDNDLPHLESLFTTITATNNHNLLKLEKQLNQLLNRSLDQYIELKGIVILANDDIMLENNSTQSVIRVSELVTVLRSYPIQFNDEQM